MQVAQVVLRRPNMESQEEHRKWDTKREGERDKTPIIKEKSFALSNFIGHSK